MTNTTFCENCRKLVNYTEKSVETSGTIKSINYHYIATEAHCTECGALVYVPEINDSNLSALYDEYRKSNNLISLEHILEIPQKYAIGKRPLSLLLGWGEQTFSRFCEGDIPSKQYSDILIKIYDDPSFYLEILESNKNNLRSETTYIKSKKAVEKILNDKLDADDIMSSTINYLLKQCGDITPLALQKALYYIQGFYSAFYDSFLFEQDCEAWIHGPVYREVYKRYRDYHYDPIDRNIETNDNSITDQQKAIYDAIIKYFCCYSGKILEQFTHNETPWMIARSCLPAAAPSGQIITRESIHKYFSNVKEKYKMISPDDIQLYSKDMFQKL